MLKQRILTAVILVPIIIAILYYLPPVAFCIFVSGIVLGAAWEWSNLMEMKIIWQRLVYLALIALGCAVALFSPILYLFFGAFIWWVVATILVILYARGHRFFGKNVFWRGLMGFFVLVPCWAAINYIRNQNEGFYALLFLFVLIWGADIAAYFVGRKWGKTKLAPRVSPGKSVQGLYGAILSSLIIASITAWLCHIAWSVWPFALGLSLMTVLFSVVGDLFESMLKREANLKDSGHLLPGHGGILDRIDSLTAAAPVFACGALLLGMIVS